MNPVRRARRVGARLLGRDRTKSAVDLDAPWASPFDRAATKDDVYYCFRLLLGRNPNREEWPGHTGNVGRDIDAVVRSYISSLEFMRRADTLSGHQLDQKIQLKKTKSFSIYVQEDDEQVGRHVLRDVYEPNVTAVFRRTVHPGMNVLDIGANIGYFTMLSASLAGPSGGVFAIEPNPDSVKLLEASRRENGFENVRIFQVAAGRAPGLLVLNRASSNAMTSAVPDSISHLVRSTTVPSFRIDDLVPPDVKIDLVKIDVEGAEYNALLGARGLIGRCHPTIVSEFSPKTMPGISGIDGMGYLRFLLDELGYRISVIDPEGGLVRCGTDAQRVMDAYDATGTDHIDLLLD